MVAVGRAYRFAAPFVWRCLIPTAALADLLGDFLGVGFLTLLARRIRVMPSAVKLREDYSADELRAPARCSKDVNQSRRLLSLAAVRDGMDRGSAAWSARRCATGCIGSTAPDPRASSIARRRVPSRACRPSSCARWRRSLRPDDEISRHVAEGAHAVLLLDRAGWHTTSNLDVPKNITPIFLPSRAPELNPVENVWQSLRSNWLSNRVFENFDAIIDAACEAWRKLTAMPETITSIGMRESAHVGQAL